MVEKQSFLDKSKGFLRAQGFYVVLFLCLLIVGAAVALTALPRENVEAPEPSPNAVVESRQSGDESLNAKRTPLPTVTPTPASPSPAITPEPTPVSRPSGGGTAKLASAPLSGEIVWGFAVDQLLYSRTLDQWTTHAGIDLAADAGTEVKAVLAGTVDKVYEDDLLGQTVTVMHTNNRTSVYANLDVNVKVKEGQKVNAGDVLGLVGKTAVSECGEASHLHFGFYINDKPVNPLEHVLIPH